MTTEFTALACPKCASRSGIQRVSALCAAGTSISHGSAVMTGFAGGHVATGYSTYTSTSTSPLAHALRLEPTLKASGPLLVWTMVLMPLTVAAAAMAAFSSDFWQVDISTTTPGQKIGAVIGKAIAVALLAGPAPLVFSCWIRARTRIQRVRRGLPNAERVWATGWYCHRCGVCFVPSSGWSMSPDQFRAAVWSAGGYHDMLR